MKLFIFNSKLPFLVVLATLIGNATHANDLHNLLSDHPKMAQMSASTFSAWLDSHSQVSIHEVHPIFGTPLQMVTILARVDLMVELHKRQVDINARNTQDETALYWAIFFHGATKPYIAETLINLRANLSVKCHGQSYMELAENLGLNDLVASLNRGPMKPEKTKAPIIPNNQITFDDDEEEDWGVSSDTERPVLLLSHDEDEEAIDQDEIDNAFGKEDKSEEDLSSDSDNDDEPNNKATTLLKIA